MKNFIISLILIVTIILLAHVWFDKTSFYSWMSIYTIVYLALFSILISVWTETNISEKYLHTIDKKNCIEFEDHYHWIGRITSILVWLIFQVGIAMFAYDYLQDPDLTNSQIRRKTALLYTAVIVSVIYIHFRGVLFYKRNYRFNRNIFLCDNYIISEYPYKKLFEDMEIKSVKIDIKDIKKIVWSPFDRTLSEDDEKTNTLEEIMNQIIAFPVNVLLAVVKFIYYLLNGFSLKYFFKNILIITENEELLIQIKSKEEYEQLKRYFAQFSIDIESINSTFLSNHYYIKD